MMAEIQGSWKITVRTNTGVILRVRNAPSLSGAIIGQLPDGSTHHASKECNGWYYIDGYNGWSSGEWMTITGGPTTTTTTTQPAPNYMSLEEAVENYANSTEESFESITNYTTKNLNGIYGIPYQFMSSVDQRLDECSYGITYGEKIISRMPLMLVTPGKVNFMRSWKDKESAANVIMKYFDKVNPIDLDDLSSKTAQRFYSFDFDYVNYYGCVNQMITSGAIFLGIEDCEVNVTGSWKKLKDVNWMDAGNDGFKGILSKKQYIAFYIDSVNTVNESFSNSSGESQLSSAANSMTDIARELQFILGNAGLPSGFNKDEALEKTMQTVDEISKKYLNDNQLLKDIGKQFGTIAMGGKLLFPEIWQDSTFTKSYNITMKLRTPDGDKLSWFMNIYVPLCHLICLAAPKQSEDGVSGYVSPFLVRAFYRGLFNCNMGLITDLNITKGKEGAWTIDGLPTEVDVDITLKDLYSALSITKDNNPAAFCRNLCLVDYIANTCGININEPDFIREIDMYIILKLNKYKHIIPNIWSLIEQDISNRIQSLYEKSTGFFF